ncbi:SixA phosphatase family protein [Winogradskyella arenosi]|uniref:Histidine phosphatase superfamily protein (Branch 1) n=1 Tax=Winogradskyella arenosi TaxID=533325 RepID=A0A368ZFG9_9FLAO|nr:phosphoglycerate mutase family protein [Winogradskyella arenosi]RCW90867.1 histidine phosphatase superfamily protein (branch 1) [Winogradskyella arenosi]
MRKQIIILLIAAIGLVSCKDQVQSNTASTSTYYLIRHAEKDRSDASNKNPDLNEKGLKRAQHWADYFKSIPFDAIYTTAYKRTEQTAQPTAEAKKLAVQYYNPSDLEINKFISKTQGKTVLIVGHSNTTPKFVNALLGEEKYEAIADDNNANLYIVTRSEDQKKSELLVVD